MCNVKNFTALKLFINHQHSILENLLNSHQYTTILEQHKNLKCDVRKLRNHCDEEWNDMSYQNAH